MLYRTVLDILFELLHMSFSLGQQKAYGGLDESKNSTHLGIHLYKYFSQMFVLSQYMIKTIKFKVIYVSKKAWKLWREKKNRQKKAKA